MGETYKEKAMEEVSARGSVGLQRTALMISFEICGDGQTDR